MTYIDRKKPRLGLDSLNSPRQKRRVDLTQDMLNDRVRIWMELPFTRPHAL